MKHKISLQTPVRILRTCIHSREMPGVRESFLPDKGIFRGPQQS